MATVRMSLPPQAELLKNRKEMVTRPGEIRLQECSQLL